jgi:outer membrane protein assembly factor BamB
MQEEIQKSIAGFSTAFILIWLLGSSLLWLGIIQNDNVQKRGVSMKNNPLEKATLLKLIIPLLCSLLVSACASLNQPLDTRMGQQVRQYYNENQAPLSQTPLKAQEVDILQWVSPTEFLVGTMELGGFPGALWSYNYSEFILVDAATGKAKWALPRKSLTGSTQSVTAVDPVIIVRCMDQNNARYHALDDTNGHELWSHEVRPPEESLQIWGKGLFLLVSSSEKAIDVTALDVKSGKTVWAKTIEDIVLPRSVTPMVTVDGDELILASSKVTKLALDDGRVVWNTPLSVDKEVSLLVLLNGSTFVGTGNTVYKIDARTGVVQWMTEIGAGNVKNLIAQAEGVYVVAGSTDNGATNDSIYALKNTTGKQLWSREFEGPVWSNLIMDKGALYASGLTNIYAINSSTGAVKFRSPLPDEMNIGTDLPDILQFVGSNIVIARESGVAAVSSQGELIFKQALPEGHAFTHDYLSNRYAESLASISGKTAIVPAMNVATIAAASSMTAAYQETAFKQASATMNSPRASLLDKRIATERALIAAKLNRSEQKMDASIALAGSIVNAAQAVGQAIEAYGRAQYIETLRQIMMHSIDIHVSSIQAGYYVRPFYRNGWYLAVVDLETGKRADLLTSPVHEALQCNAMNLPSYSVDPSGMCILTRGIGSDPSQWTTYTKFGGQEIPTSGIILGKIWTIPYPSLLTYNISQIKSDTYEHISSPSMKKPATNEKMMIEAAFTGNYESVKSLLDSGVNVNAADEYGHTALMHAALMMNHKMVKLLLDRGADVAQMDHGGYTAWHFYVFPIRASIHDRQRTNDLLWEKYKALQNSQPVTRE